MLQSLIDRAIINDNVDDLQTLLPTENINSKLLTSSRFTWRAATHGSWRVLRWLLENGALIIDTDVQLCASTGRTMGVRLFVAAGADRNMALQLAVNASDPAMARVLLQLGAHTACIQVNRANAHWWAALMAERDRCRAAAVALLGARRHGRSPVLASINMDATRIIAWGVWRTRWSGEWVSGGAK